METDEWLKMGLEFDIFGYNRSNRAGICSVYDIQQLFAVHLVTLPFVSPDYETLHIDLTRHLKLLMGVQMWTGGCKENKVKRKKEFLFKLC